MKKFNRILKLGLVLGLILTLATPVFADSHKYEIPITVTETGGSIQTQIPILVPLPNGTLVDLDYLKASGLDTRLQEVGVDRYYMVADDKLGFMVPVLAAYQNKELTYYTSYDPDNPDNYGIILGTDGYVTITDDADLELGNNFELEWRGYIDTSSGADKNILYKRNGIAIYISGSESITAALITDTTAIEYLFPEGTGTYSEIGGVNDWQAVDDPVGSPDDGSGKIQTNAGYDLDTFLTSDSSLASDTIINNVRVYVRIASDGGSNYAYAQPVILLDGSQSSGSTTPGTGSSWTTYDRVVSKPGGGYWTLANLNDMEIGLRLKEQGGSADAMCTQVYGAVEYVTGFSNDVDVTAINVSSGVHTIKVTADGTDLEISIDSAVAGDGYDTTVLGGETVPNNGYEWVLDQNNVMPYMEYYKHTVSGTLIAHYEPNTIIIGTELVDRQGGNEDGEITWGSEAPSGVSVEVGALIAYTNPVSGVAGADGVGGPEVAGETQEPVGLSGGAADSDLPMFPLFDPVAAALGWETSVLYVFAIFVLSIGLGVALLLSTGSILFAVAGVGVGMAVGIATGMLPVWILAVYLILGGTWLYVSRSM